MSIDHEQEPALLRQTRILFIEGTLGGLTDAELLERFVEQEGERSELAFTVLLERHARMVLAACRRVLGNPHDVQDAFQATFLILVRKARSIRNRQSVAGWLQSVAYRVACSAQSAADRRRFHERVYAHQSERGHALEIRQDADVEALLDQELSRLPESQRVAIVLCDLEGLTYEQAAQALGWPMGTVKSRLARGRDRLRSRLIHRGVTPSLAVIAGIGSPDFASVKVSSVLLQSTVNAAMSNALSRSMAIAISPGVLKLVEGAMMSMLLTKAKLSIAAIAVGSCLVATTTFFVGPRLKAAAQDTQDARSLPGGEGKSARKLPSQSSPPSAQPSTIEELEWLKMSNHRLAATNNRLQVEVQVLQDELARLRAGSGSTSVSARKDEASNDPRLVKGSPVAPPPAASLRTDRGSDPISRTPAIEALATQSQSAWLKPGRQRRPFLRCGDLIFASSPTGNKVVAHNVLTQKEQWIFLNANTENPLEVSFIEMNEVVGLNLKGSKITRTAVYNLRTGVWIPLDFSEPVSGEVRNSNTGNGTLAYDVGRHFYTFNIQTGKLDHFDLDKITDTDH